MKKEDLVILGLDEKTAENIAKASREELKGFIPRKRFNEVNESKKQLQTLVNEKERNIKAVKTLLAGITFLCFIVKGMNQNGKLGKM